MPLSNDIIYLADDGRVMRIRGSHYDHAQDYEPTRYRKEKMTMKPGPYKSRTHGPIPLSLRGRELMMELRNAITGGLEEVRRKGGQTSHTADLISSTRGELAKYMSELEAYAEEFHRVAPVHIKLQAGEPPHTRKRPTTGTEIMNQMKDALYMARYPRYTVGFDIGNDSADAMRFLNIAQFQNKPKDIPMTENTEQTKTPVEKTRSQLIGEATHELVDAQRHLERVQSAPAIPPALIGLHAPGYGAMADAISQLVTEQWTNLAKKAVARAKARVSKAEKAVSELLA